jgi:DNA polymerase-3 subunit epsilon
LLKEETVLIFSILKCPINTTGVAGFLDVETTGLDPFTDEIIELAITLFLFNYETGEILEILDEFVGLREPNKKITCSAKRIHGITNEEVRGRKLDKEHILLLISNADFLIAHNATFDRSFMVRLFPDVGHKSWLCSMKGINWKQKGFASRSLLYLLQAHGIKCVRAHRAGNDVRGAIELLSLYNNNNKTYLYELVTGKHNEY